MLYVLEEDGEFIAAETRHGVALVHAAAQALGHDLQKPVADVVPEGVVDVLEPVEVEKHDPDDAPAPLRARERLVEAIEEQHAVRELRERVVVREIL